MELEKVDWDLLHEQKKTLLSLLLSPNLSDTQRNHLDGLVNFIDSIQDDAVAEGLWIFPDSEGDGE